VLNNLAAFPWITGVQVRRQWPNTVSLRVYETHAVAVAFNASLQLEYVGVEGQDLGPAPLKADLPTLSMATSTAKWPFTRTGLGAVTVAEAIPASFGSQISRIIEYPNGTVRIALTTPVTFILGPAVDLEKKFVAVASVIANYVLSPGETIDVTIPGEIAVTPAKG
jgi:POTRA domain, FtsQ-type